MTTDAGLYAAEETERAVQDELDARPLPPKMTRHVRDQEHDQAGREWVPGTVEHDRASNREALYRAQYEVQTELNRLGIWNRPERLAMTGRVLRDGGRLDDEVAAPASFADLTMDDAMYVAARLREEPTPDVDAGV